MQKSSQRSRKINQNNQKRDKVIKKQMEQLKKNQVKDHGN